MLEVINQPGLSTEKPEFDMVEEGSSADVTIDF